MRALTFLSDRQAPQPLSQNRSVLALVCLPKPENRRRGSLPTGRTLEQGGTSNNDRQCRAAEELTTSTCNSHGLRCPACHRRWPIRIFAQVPREVGLLVSATFCVVLGWMAFFRYREGEPSLRGRIALITSVYLTLSLPAFFIEFSPLMWFVHAHWARIYVRPWVHWGFVPIYLSVACAFFGRGRSRVAFILASTLLAVLWESMSRWI